MLVACYLLHVACCMLLVAYCLLHVACCLLLVVCCILLVFYFLSPIAYFYYFLLFLRACRMLVVAVAIGTSVYKFVSLLNILYCIDKKSALNYIFYI